VYLQYAHARICSIIRKSNKDVEELKMVNLVFYTCLVIGVAKVLVSFLLVISHGLKFSLTVFPERGNFSRPSR
jgi:arginyl-tRNA synthetase